MARSVRVDLIADPRRYTSGFDKANKSTKRFSDETSRAGSALKGAFAAFSAAVVVRGLNSAVQAASSMNETVNKTQVVFGPASKSVEDFAKTAAKSIFMSRQEALEAAATFGNLFVSMKIGAPQAAEMSTKMVQLAGDLASFNNASPADTLEALRSGLVGETEPLRKFGINLNDADLRQKALSLGLVKTTKEVLPPAIKAQASYALILEQSKTAQGDAARTAGSLANKQKALSSQWKDAQAVIGALLLPVMLTLVSAMSGLITVIDENRTAFGILFGVLATGALVVGTLVAISKIHKATTEAITVATAAWETVQKTLNGTLSVAAARLIAFSAYGAAAAVAFGTLTYNVEQLKTKGLSEGRFLDPASLAIKKVGELTGWWGDETKKQGEKQKGANQSITEAVKAAQDKAAADQAAAAASAAHQQQLGAMTAKLQESKEAFKQQSQAVQDSIESYEGLVTQSDVTTKQVVEDLSNQVANFKTYSSDVQSLIKKGVNPAAIRELSEKGPQYIHALAEGSDKQLAAYQKHWRDRQAAVKGSFADSMEKQYQGLVDKIKKMQREINSLKGKTVAVGAVAKISLQEKTRQALNAMGIKGYGVKFLAAGGMTRLGQTAIVGEKGPELVRFTQPAQVYPAGETKDILRRGMADGGLVGGFGQPSMVFARQLGQAAGERLATVAGNRLAGVVKDWAGGTLGGLSGAGGWQWQMSVLRNQFPGMQLISGFRPGAITATGNPSYHGFGRAVDIPPNMGYFNWIRSNYGRNTKELIFSPAGNRQVHNGQPHVYSGITRANHWDHVHWAYDKGGWLPPGLSMAYNGTGRPERVLPPGKGGGDIHVHLHGDVYGDTNALVAKVRNGIKEAQRHAGVPATQQLR